MITFYIRICCQCHKFLGIKVANGKGGVCFTHGLCRPCLKEQMKYTEKVLNLRKKIEEGEDEKPTQ